VPGVTEHGGPTPWVSPYCSYSETMSRSAEFVGIVAFPVFSSTFKYCSSLVLTSRNVNIAFVGDQEVESGLGSTGSRDAALGIEIENEADIETETFPPPAEVSNFRRPSMLQIPYRIAISVEGGQKKFGELKVLECLNMSVQEGTM